MTTVKKKKGLRWGDAGFRGVEIQIVYRLIYYTFYWLICNYRLLIFYWLIYDSFYRFMYGLFITNVTALFMTY